MKTLGVVGLGYVGLPLAVQAAEKGYKVTGVDLNTDLIASINARKSPYVNDKRFDKAFAKISQESLTASNSFDDLKNVETVVICVPTPTEDNVPNLSYVTQAAKQVAEYLKPGQLICLESTVNPGVTRDVVLPILEQKSGLTVGKGFYLAHCPERIDPGNEKYYVGNLNRVVGGITNECTKNAVKFYSSVVDAKIISLGSTEEAEFVKSWENSHRNVMIALANSAAIICDSMGMDISRVLVGLQSKVDQFGLKLAQPGIGPGGHCIPEDIHYVIKRARQNGIDTRFLDDAAELNDKMTKYAVRKLSKLVESNGEKLKDLNVALLGLSYKPNIADTRRSPSIEIGHSLVRYAKSVFVHDPYNNGHSLIKGAIVAMTTEEALQQADVVFVATAHDEYLQELNSKTALRHGVRYVLDGRNCLDKESFMASGVLYQGIGR